MKARRSISADKLLYNELLSRRILQEILMSKKPNIEVTIKTKNAELRVSELKK